MATNLPYNDSVFLFRLQTLILDVGTEIVRNIFNYNLNNQPLVTFLTNEKATINRLRAKKTITKGQYDKLFPPGEQNPDSEDFDITLLMCLLKSIPSLGLNMMYPWYTSPTQTDTSIEADLIRLRTYRNEIAHASSTHRLDERIYKQQWNKVEQCLLRLNIGPQSDPNLQANIDSFKNSHLDPATEQRLDKQWQELENFLESESNIIMKDNIYTRTNIGEVTGDISMVKGDVAVVTGDVGKVRGEQLGIGKVEGEQLQNRDTKKSRREEVSAEENAQKEESGSLNDCRRIITNGYTTLVNYMKPGPLLDCAVECKLFNYRTVRDIKEVKNNTSDRNRYILENVRRRGVAGLKKFKECLKKSRQTKIADFIDRIEKGMDTDEIKRQIAEEASLRDAQKEESESLNDCRRIIANGYLTLVNYMKPGPLLDCAVECKLFNYRTVRDIKGDKNNTSDRNRYILENVRRRGVAGLKKFKECLKKSRQTKIADFIDRIEKGMDTDEIKRQIAEEASLHDAQKGESGSLNDCRRIIANGYTTFVNYMEPGPLLDCAVENKLFDYRTVRDLKEEQIYTSERNRKLLEIVSRRGDAGFKKFKECLKKSRQTKMAELIDLIEKGMDTDEIKRQIAEEASLHLFQECLIETYRSDYNEMNLFPLLNKGTPFLQFYQMPDLKHVTENIELGRAAKEEQTPIDTWEKLFDDSNEANPRSIYICADAGLGKTAFSKYLALSWCQSKKPLQEESEFFKPEQLEAIGKFRFVFLLFLRESQKSNLCHLTDMIWEQLVSKFICSYEIKGLENILRNEKCLIILDGLDEWSHPPTCGKREQVPHWSKRENVAVITTTRPWKFNVAGLKSGQIDHKIELTGLNQNSAKTLKYSYLSYFKMQQLKVEYLRQRDINEIHSSVKRFTRTVSDKHATQLESVPLMLMYMLFLFMYGFNLGDTKCDLYCRIIELLLSRTFEDQQKTVTSTTDKIPPCFNKLKHCLKFYNPYLKPLGELAFKTLLEEKKEKNTLVFDSSVAIKCLGEECFNQCLKTGIISQSKCVQTDLSIQESTVTFSHKTMQEFFAALYMYSAPDDTRMSQLVLSKCKNVQDILDMSNIIMFISGMNVNVAALISRGMMNIINKDTITQKYRNTKLIGSYIYPLDILQDMIVSCCKEMPCASGGMLYIQDVFIDKSCKDEEYRVHLKQLIQDNNNNIKSVFIHMLYMEDTPYNSVQKVFKYFQLEYLNTNVEISCLSGFGRDVENISLC